VHGEIRLSEKLESEGAIVSKGMNDVIEAEMRGDVI
jgi:hypothetical protein